MALIGNIIAEAIAGNPSIINYSMFVAVFSMLSLFYLILATLSDRFTINIALPLVFDVLNTLFFFCGAVALAAELGVHSCSNKVSRKLKMCRKRRLTLVTGLSEAQPCHKWSYRHERAMPGSSGLHRLPMVRLCLLFRFYGPVLLFLPRGRRWRYKERWASYVSGLGQRHVPCRLLRLFLPYFEPTLTVATVGLGPV